MRLHDAMRWIAMAATMGICACGDEDEDTTGTQGTTSATDGTTTDTTTTDTTTSTTAGTVTTDSSTSSDPSTTDATTTTDGTTTSDGSSGSTTGADTSLSFFATSVGSGVDGGNLGGPTGADATCQTLADAVGQGAKTWHAYLSTDTEDARDRIGSGPWYNFDGDMIAADVASLHSDGLSNGDPQHVLDENGDEIPGNEHDILTGSLEDGTVDGTNHCANWTSDGGGDEARVGHSDIPSNTNFSPSWNSAHVVGGCTQDALDGTGGAGRLYCFAV